MSCPLFGDREGQWASCDVFAKHPKLGVLYARLVLDDQRPAIRNRCLTLLEEEDDVVRYVASIPLLDW